ncbi:hypothetical protein MTO96_029065 [Rhipicephalus appendiculatus]
MLKFTLLLLLCTAFISATTPDLFRGCVPSSGNRTATHRCIIIPKKELHLNLKYYTILAEKVLQKSSNQLHKRFLNTVYKITRAAIQNGFRLHIVHDVVTEWLRGSSAKHDGVPRLLAKTSCIPL